MNKVALVLAINLGSLACVVGAILLALNDKGGWGWFLIAGVVMGGSNAFMHDPFAETF
jgi:hypothetical protein